MDTPEIELPEFKIPALKEWPILIKNKLKQYKRVYKITKKPSTEEFLNIVKVTGIGTLLIGAIGFTIFLIVHYLKVFL